jgi:hypothetical protein
LGKQTLRFSQSWIETAVDQQLSSKTAKRQLQKAAVLHAEGVFHVTVQFDGGFVMVPREGIFALLEQAATAEGLRIDPLSIKISSVDCGRRFGVLSQVTAPVVGAIYPTPPPPVSLRETTKMSLKFERIKQLLTAQLAKEGLTIELQGWKLVDSASATACYRRKLQNDLWLETEVESDELKTLLTAAFRSEGLTVDPDSYYFWETNESRCEGLVVATDFFTAPAAV